MPVAAATEMATAAPTVETVVVVVAAAAVTAAAAAATRPAPSVLPVRTEDGRSRGLA